jgi:hypothetical protein
VEPLSPDDTSHANVIAYTWRHEDERRLVAINYSDVPARGVVLLPDFELSGQKWTLREVLARASTVRPGGELSQRGVTLDLASWQASIIAFVPRPAVEPAPDAAQRPT